jgi:DNA modification methylase
MAKSMTTQQIRTLKYLNIADIKPDPRNPRKHNAAQIEAIKRSIKGYGFNAPILIDKQRIIIAGHGRHKAAMLLGLTEVPVICLDNLTEAQARAYMIADNQLNDRSSWCDRGLAIHLKELSDLALEFSIEDTGFSLPEIDIRIQSLDVPPKSEPHDEFLMANGPAVSRPGDLFHLGSHRLFCGNSLEDQSFIALMGDEAAAGVFSDAPYNLKIDGNVSGKGATKHGDFAMASGEMTQSEFTQFLGDSMARSAKHSAPGAIVYMCMDFRHMVELQQAAQANKYELLNLCVWIKTNGGMGSFYRSAHELVFVFAKKGAKRINNVQLGRFGRNRTNVWHYAGANVGGEKLLALHPTVKPIMLVSDAMRDSTKRGDIVLDPFLGSGTSILAAERCGRRCYGIELDPLYVDTAIARWERLTGREALHASGRAFSELRAERGGSHE